MSTLESPDANELETILKDLRGRLSRIHHDLNNPLSIISGNAQLLQELAKALDVDDELAGPLDDLERAVDKLTESADQLIIVREMLVEYLGRTESG
jgi:signal transduction histidine kinase